MILVKLFWEARKFAKHIYCHKLAIENLFSWCKDCGIEVKDFLASTKLWMGVTGDFRLILCYNCFINRARKKGLDCYGKIVQDKNEEDTFKIEKLGIT